ncbi:Transcription factor bHLH110 [Vitis vinifera]|uniref:Transcription factor bHLH110 n=1 Tax=Vitis vinifera TaxID=29760 RepID=A0A438K639_VITVI|nr:Transcription factor bHLH110 [Vitis vinifera]
MESVDVHRQHQLQEQFIINGCSSLDTHAVYGVPTIHGRSPSITMNGSNHTYGNEIFLPNSRESPTEVLNFTKIKEELPNSFPKFGEMVDNHSNVEELHLVPSIGSYMKHGQQPFRDLSENLCWLSSNSSEDFNFWPEILTQMLENLKVMEVHTHLADSTSAMASANYGRGSSKSSHDDLDPFKESMPLDHDHMQESNHNPSNSSKMTSAFMNGVSRTKVTRSRTAPKALHAATKMSGFGPRSSYPPLKVRKEKLGDRIAALQRLVAPFGKNLQTDTASVLTEAIGYIQFLHDQIQTLSVPYMKSSQSKSLIPMQWGSSDEHGKEGAKRDLRSRGLCLVPVSCTSYITACSGGVWTPL